MKITLIITTYNWPQALELCMQSVLAQTRMPDEIIIADDGSTKETKDLIANFKLKHKELNIIHSWQEDHGFRAAKSRNKATFKSSSEYLIFVDGDMVLEKDFVKNHEEKATQGTFLQGSRVLLRPEFTNEILKTKRFEKPSIFSSKIKNNLNSIKCNFLSKIIYRLSRNSFKGIRSCNTSLFKKDLLRVNGFNEDFTSWGREDSELVARLFNAGINRRNLKFAGIQYHLYHKEGSSNSKNDALLKKAIDEKHVWCDDGIDKYYNNFNKVND